jgi:Major intrinsic protein
MNLGKRSAAEFFGTFWLVFGGCGSAVLAAAFPGLGIGFAGVALAFGLTVLTMAFAIGHISGCHLNPAVTAGLVAGKRFPAKEFLPYVLAQVVGAFAAAGTLYVIASGKAGFSLAGGVRFQRLWGTLSRRIFAHGMFRSRSRSNHVFPADHHGLNRPARPAGLRSDCDRPGPDADSPGRHSRNQHVGQSGAQHRPGPVCRRMGRASALVILAGPDYRRSPGRSRIPGPVRRSGPQSRTQARARASSQESLAGIRVERTLLSAAFEFGLGVAGLGAPHFLRFCET